jgi:hypothetical protein
MLIIRLAAKPPYRRGPLSSNVRPLGHSAGQAQAPLQRRAPGCREMRAELHCLLAPDTRTSASAPRCGAGQVLVSQWTQAPQGPFRRWAQTSHRSGVAQESWARVSLKHDTAPVAALERLLVGSLPGRWSPLHAAGCRRSPPSRWPNWSLERTLSGKAPWPRGALCLSSASRPRRLASGVRSAQTLGRTRATAGASCCEHGSLRPRLHSARLL